MASRDHNRLGRLDPWGSLKTCFGYGRPLALALALGPALTFLACSGDATDTMNPDPGQSFMPAAPSAYTAKVKNLLTGLAVTDAELQAVTANPQALAGLIDQWMMQPQFADKMIDFFQQAFQQTQINEAEFEDQLQNNVTSWNGVDRVKFLYSAENSFPLTALELVASGQPFTNTVTTDTFMLNVPLMAALALNDLYVFDDNGNSVPGTLLTRFPGFKFTRTTDAVPFTDTINPASPNFMVWNDPMPYTGPNMSCTVYPYTIDSKTTAHLRAAMLWMGARLFGGRPGCGATASEFTAADYMTWRMVKIRKPMPGEQTTLPWDLPTLRDPNTKTLVLNTPRVGFMTTLAFNANWPTNLSNLARVTVNQTLVVALGKTLADPSAAVPVTETGLPPAAHAQPGTVCYNCHVTLDPMRNFFRQSYSVTYHQQTLTLPMDQATAEYSYDGLDIKGQGNGIAELAQALIQSPSFATAWTQKLCQFANSSSCSPDDPEFLRVAQVFQQSNFNFKALVHELFSSPLVTGAAITKTAMDNGTVISVSRREHFCAALSNRLGMPDACSLLPTKESVIQDEAFGIPGSAYSRGSPSPLLPHDPDLFFYSAVENLCAQIATLVIDPAKPCTGAQRCWSSTQPPATSINDFVTTLMSIPPSDERAGDLIQILTDHYNAANTSAGSAKVALQSTFTLACASPASESSGL